MEDHGNVLVGFAERVALVVYGRGAGGVHEGLHSTNFSGTTDEIARAEVVDCLQGRARVTLLERRAVENYAMAYKAKTISDLLLLGNVASVVRSRRGAVLLPVSTHDGDF